MIKKMQLKFVSLSMTAFFIFLVVLIGGINIVNYHSMIKDVDELLSILSDNKGDFPDFKPKPDMKPLEKDFMEMPPHLSPETPYESRYFSVTLDSESGSVIQTEMSRIVSVDSSSALEYAQIAFEKESEKGFLDQFRYIKHEEDNEIRIIFLDCGRKIDAFQNFLFVSIGISFLGYIIVFFIISFYSKKIIHPISESYKKQKRFITDAGHEIKTPLTIIAADADVLELEYGENEWVDDIKKQTKRLTALTNDLVYLTRMEEEERKINMIDFSLSEMVEELCSSFQILANTKEKDFSYKIQPDLFIKGDEMALEQLISILLDNAFKYSPSCGKIRLELEKQNKVLILSVFNDTEISLEDRNLSLLFDRFYRADSSRNSETGGYGIGLSIAKAIVSAHNGKINAASNRKNSLSITVNLPM